MAEPALDPALRSASTIRERCANIAAAVDAGRSRHFTIDRAQLPAIADRVARVTRARYPEGAVPLHSRWRQFDAGGVPRRALLDRRLAARTVVGQVRARIELALVSVLLDAGAGPGWRYTEPGTDLPFTRSEGLAVATFNAFLAGAFSSDSGDPCRVDAKALLRTDVAALAAILQVDAGNPLVGLDGRVALLRRLGRALREQPEIFTAEGLPGHLFDALTHHRHAHHLPHANLHHVAPATFRHHLAAPRMLDWLLETLGSVWSSDTGDDTVWSGGPLQEEPPGDVWRHPAAGGGGPTAGWVPFHKLAQWLVYSLVEPFEAAGVRIEHLDGLTALPEYRNGGLLLDGGVIVPRDPDHAKQSYRPGSQWVVEWRALTVALIDELAPLVRERLGVDAEQLPLARLLEGGTWYAGREIAAERREGGVPPVFVDSDGTLF